MDKKTTGIVSYITLIGWLISFKPVTGVIPCITDQQHYYFAHSDLWMGCQRHSLHCILYFLDHGISICLQR